MVLLQSLAKAGRPLTLSELTLAMGTNRPTANRFCHTLAHLGFIQRDTEKRYNLTPKVLTLGYGVIRGQDWVRIARYYLEGLFNEIRKTVNLAVLDDNEVLYLQRIKVDNTLPFDLQVGSKLPVYSSSTGKVLMAFGCPEEVQPIIQKLEFKRFTQKTITCLKAYLKELEKVRKKGYAVNDGEFEEGIRSVAAPIRDEHGWAKAAINIILPIKICSRSELEEIYAPYAMKTGEEISHALRETAWPFYSSRRNLGQGEK